MLALALVAASALLLIPIGGTLWGSEGRWLDVAREMARSGDWFSMRIAREPYLDKPFGSYWLVILAAQALGGFSVIAGRLPGVLAFLGTLLATCSLGRRTLGARAGALGALLLALSPRLLMLADTTSADPQQLLGITLSMLLLLEAVEGGRWRHFVLLGAVAGLATQMKGLPALALPAFAAALWALLVRGWRGFPLRGLLLSALIAAALAGAPFVVARLQHGDWDALRQLWHESVVRALDPFDHVLPWWFYLHNQFVLLSAWSALLPAALLLAGSRVVREDRWRARLQSSEPERRAAFPLFGYVVVMLFFSVSFSRRSYYLLPIAPFAALLVADVLLAATGGTTALARRLGLVALGLCCGLLGLFSGAVGVARLALTTPPALLAEHLPDVANVWPVLPPWLAATALLVVPAAALLAPGLAPRLLLPCVAAALAVPALLMLGVVIPVRSDLDPLPRFAAAVRATVPDGEEIDLADIHEARLSFYLDPPSTPPSGSARFRIVSEERARVVLAHEPAWTRRSNALLDAAAWPAGAHDGLVLLERGASP
jgi:4-amino-4-deoxy-L-arabinose transferase-like glycosyltransferase